MGRKEGRERREEVEGKEEKGGRRMEEGAGRRVEGER